MNKLKVALPVMLNSSDEIETFYKAKDRIEKLGDKIGVPIEVGVFLNFLPGFSRKPEKFGAQLENQKKHKLPIFIAETGVQRQNCLAYGLGDPTYNSEVQSDLEATIEQVAKLRDFDKEANPSLVVAPHVGVLVPHDMSEGDFSHPGFYSVSDFVKNRSKLFARAVRRFENLSNFAAKEGLVLALENAYHTFENSSFWQGADATPGLHYQPFNDFNSLNTISGSKLVLDVPHLSAARNTVAQLERNEVPLDNLLDVEGILEKEDYMQRHLPQHVYRDRAVGFHLSHADGIGIRLEKGSELGRSWGDSSGADLTPMVTYINTIDFARKNSIPVVIEEAYSFKPLTFGEADAFLEPILERMN